MVYRTCIRIYLVYALTRLSMNTCAFCYIHVSKRNLKITTMHAFRPPFSLSVELLSGVPKPYRLKSCFIKFEAGAITPSIIATQCIN